MSGTTTGGGIGPQPSTVLVNGNSAVTLSDDERCRLLERLKEHMPHHHAVLVPKQD